MGRANRPTRRVHVSKVKAGDVVLVRSPDVPNTRWLLVDYVTPAFVGPPHMWSGRWAFGADAGRWTIVRARDGEHTVKHHLDARRDFDRLA